MADPYGDPAAADSGFAGLFDDPRARAALLQIGLNLLQPAYGQSLAGHIGGSIAGGGEAVARIEEGDRKAAESDSKIAKREADISAAQGRLDSAAHRQAGREDYLNFREGKQQQDNAVRNAALGFSQLKFNLDREAKDNNRQDTILDRQAQALYDQVQGERKKEAKAKSNLIDQSYTFPSDLAPYRNVRTPAEARAIMQNDPIQQQAIMQVYGNQGSGRQANPETIPGDQTAPGQFPKMPIVDGKVDEENLVRGRTYLNNKNVPVRYLGNGEWSTKI